MKMLNSTFQYSPQHISMRIQFSDLHSGLLSSLLWFHIILSAETHPDYDSRTKSTRKDSKDPPTPTPSHAQSHS